MTSVRLTDRQTFMIEILENEKNNVLFKYSPVCKVANKQEHLK